MHPLGGANCGASLNFLLLGGLILIVFTPIAAVMRLLRHDPLAFGSSKRDETFWRPNPAAGLRPLWRRQFTHERIRAKSAAGPFERLWVQPASGDAGGAIGAALYGWHQIKRQPRAVDEMSDTMSGSYLGPEFSDEEIERYLQAYGYPYEEVAERGAWARRIAELVAEGKVIGLFVGRMEFGPRALGHRSIIADPRSPAMQSIMNLKIKYRESFRPFAPSVLAERASDVFDLDVESPYMMLVAPVREHLRSSNGHRQVDDLRAWVNEVRSTIPAVTHVDFSARIPTVNQAQSPEFHAVIEAFNTLTGCPVVINTSFNVRGEPIVCTPDDAYRCFMRTEIDHLVLGPFLLDKRAQPSWTNDDRWQEDFILD